MNLREHLDKGIWAAADKGLLLLYGFAVIIVVINVLPDSEWAAFSLFQSIFIIICVLSDSIFLQPMVKFASEHEAEVSEILAASFTLYTVVMLAIGSVFAICADGCARLFASPELGMLLPWLPLLLVLNIFRNVGIRYLQISYRISNIFWADLAFYGSITLLTILAHSLGLFRTADDFLKINMIGGALSSLVAILYCGSAFRKMPIFHVPRTEYAKLLSFAKYQAGTSVLLTFQQWADVLVVGVYAPTYVALYSAAKTLYRFFDAVRDGATLLIVPVASRLHTGGDSEKLSALVEKLLFLAFAALIPISLILALGAEPMLTIFYKNKFPGIIPVFQILILSGFVLPLALVSTNVLIGIGRVRELFFAVTGATLVFFVLNRLLVPPMGASGAALSVLVSTSVLGIGSFIAMRHDLAITTTGILSHAKDIKQMVGRGK